MKSVLKRQNQLKPWRRRRHCRRRRSRRRVTGIFLPLIV